MQYVFRAGLLTLLLATSPGLAQSANEPSAAGKQPDLGAGQRGPGDKSKGEDEGPDTEDMFGFTVGTDVIEPGRLEVSGEAVSRLGKRLGRYQADAFRSTVTFAPIEGLSIEPGVIGHHFSIRNVSGLDNRSFTGFGGVSAEIKWRILKRGDPSPFGLTLLAQPRMGLLDESSGERGRSQGLETRLLLDTALIPNTVYASLNVIYEMDKFRPRGVNLFSSKGEELDVPLTPCVARPSRVKAAPGEGDDVSRGVEGANANETEEPCTALGRRKSAEHSSNVGVSGALAFQAFPNVFLGAEVEYLRAYEGLTLQHFRGEAVFVGPTLFAKLTDHLSITAALSTQVSGHAVGVPGRLDLDNFSRHHARLKVFFEF